MRGRPLHGLSVPQGNDIQANGISVPVPPRGRRIPSDCRAEVVDLPILRQREEMPFLFPTIRPLKPGTAFCGGMANHRPSLASDLILAERLVERLLLDASTSRARGHFATY